MFWKYNLVTQKCLTVLKTVAVSFAAAFGHKVHSKLSSGNIVSGLGRTASTSLAPVLEEISGFLVRQLDIAADAALEKRADGAELALRTGKLLWILRTQN